MRPTIQMLHPSSTNVVTSSWFYRSTQTKSRKSVLQGEAKWSWLRFRIEKQNQQLTLKTPVKHYIKQASFPAFLMKKNETHWLFLREVMSVLFDWKHSLFVAVHGMLLTKSTFEYTVNMLTLHFVLLSIP